jgi:hypothetical protein
MGKKVLISSVNSHHREKYSLCSASGKTRIVHLFEAVIYITESSLKSNSNLLIVSWFVRMFFCFA